VQALVEALDGPGKLLRILNQVLARRGLAHVGDDIFAEVPDLIGHPMDEVAQEKMQSPHSLRR